MRKPEQNRDSSNDDVASSRERARERRGYVTASGARAFLAVARRPLAELAAMPKYDLETQRHFAGLAAELRQETDSRAPGRNDDASQQVHRSDTTAPDPGAAHLAALHTALEEAGLLEAPSARLLLRHEATSEQLPIVRLLEALAAKDAAEFDARSQELAYLGSVLIAGIAVGGVALSPTEARDAVLATCNLGLETLMSNGRRVRIDRGPGLVRLFLVGLNVLSALPGRATEAFGQRLETLKKATFEPLHEWLVEQAEVSVADLREAVGKGDFAAAREAAMALCFVFEPRACRAVVPLLDELPRLARGEGGAVSWIDCTSALAAAEELLRGIGAKRLRRS